MIKFSTKEKRFWKTKFSFKDLKNIPKKIEHLNLRDEYLSNEELFLIANRITEIEILDLDNNSINDEGVPYLTKIRGIKELRLKSLNISDVSIPYLIQLKYLELLHLGGTKITCDGILELSKLESLKTLLASPEKIEKQKLDQFLAKNPGCELIINYKIYP